MKKTILILLVILVAGTAFAGKIGGDAGASILLGMPIGGETTTDSFVGYGAFVDYITTIGKEGKAELAVGSRVDVCTNDIEASGFFLSGLACTGVNVNISKSFSFYAMPGFGAYFVAGYKGNEGVQLNLLGLGLMTGLRYSIGESGFLLSLNGSVIYPLSNLTAKEASEGTFLLTNVGLGVGVSF